MSTKRSWDTISKTNGNCSLSRVPISKCLIMVETSLMTSDGCDGCDGSSRDTWFVKVFMRAMMTKGLSCVFGFYRLDSNCYNVCLKRDSL